MPTAVTSCFFAVGGQSLFRRDLLVGLDSIDELLWPMYHEDIELSYRAWKAGLRILYAPDAVCHHLGSQTSARVFTRVELRSFVRQNELLTVWKNVDDPRDAPPACRVARSAPGCWRSSAGTVPR